MSLTKILKENSNSNERHILTKLTDQPSQI